MLRPVLTILALILAASASAQDRRPSHCFAIAQTTPGAAYIQNASWRAPIADEWTVRMRYIDHSMYLIQSHGGLNVVTDYNGFIGTGGPIPDVVTMNNAHDTHWTSFPHPDIPHVLEGWRQAGEPADHYLDLGEMLIRNATTDIRDPWGNGNGITKNNSIFIFEIAGLCIGHLGHLHHEPSDETYAAIGRLDVVMAAVDGGMTVDTDTMVRIAKRLRSSYLLPMHWRSAGALDRFLAEMAPDFEIERPGTSELTLSLRTLPSRPTVLVLEPLFIQPSE